jgi:AAA15 family ATPase/GTPase
MLKRFIVENFLSYKEESILDLTVYDEDSLATEKYFEKGEE